MKHINRGLYIVGLVLLALGVLWAFLPGGGLVLAQSETPRPTPTNEGGATPVPDPVDTPVPDPTDTPSPRPTATLIPDPTATPMPEVATPVPTSVPADPPREEPAAPAQQEASANPVAADSLGENALPRTGFRNPGTWSTVAAALLLVGVIVQARYLRRKGKDRDA
jgi:outer membrane biosynthesis protein TonB